MVAQRQGYLIGYSCCVLFRTGTLLIIDETHTISAGPGGYTHREGLQPDMLVIGKPIAGASSVSITLIKPTHACMHCAACLQQRPASLLD
jgi:glutamate-1-semialdehyde aminotransferase